MRSGTGTLVKEPRTKVGKFLSFALAAEVYGVGLHHVREIIGMVPITLVPNTPKFIKGVINLRGKIIPVVDLRLKFGMSCREYSRDTCIVVVDVVADNGQLLMGVIVDAVSEVVAIPDGEIDPTPSFGVQVNTDFILGIARVSNRVILLLDIEKVLSQEELVQAESAVESLAAGASSKKEME